MAVVNPNQNDPNNQTQQGTQNNNTSTTGSGVSTVTAGSKGASGASSNAAPTVQSAGQTQNSTPSSSGSFTNLKNYLNANNGGQQFTQQINNNLQQQGQQLQNSVNNASQQFNQQAQSVVNPYQTAYQNFNQNGGSTGNAAQITGYTKANNNNAESVKNLENASYTGPRSLNDLQGSSNGNAIQSNINNYSTLANNTGTEAGRFNILQNMFGGQGYTQGQQTLDNMFINPSQLSASRSLANQTQNAYNQAANNAQTEGQNYQNQVKQMAGNTVNSLNNAVGNVGQAIQQQYTNNLAQAPAQLAAYQAALKSGNISQDLANQLGLKNGENIYNTNLSDYVNQNNNYSARDAATADQYNQISALNNLIGQNAAAPQSQILQEFANAPAQQQNIVNFDKTGLGNAISSAQNSYNTGINSSLDAINNMSPDAKDTLLTGGGAYDPLLNETIGSGGGTAIAYNPADVQQILGNQYAQQLISGYNNGTDNNGSLQSPYYSQLAALQNLVNQYDPTKTVSVQ